MIYESGVPVAFWLQPSGDAITDDLLLIARAVDNPETMERLIEAFENFKGEGYLTDGVRARIKEVTRSMKKMKLPLIIPLIVASIIK